VPRVELKLGCQWLHVSHEWAGCPLSDASDGRKLGYLFLLLGSAISPSVIVCDGVYLFMYCSLMAQRVNAVLGKSPELAALND